MVIKTPKENKEKINKANDVLISQNNSEMLTLLVFCSVNTTIKISVIMVNMI